MLQVVINWTYYKWKDKMFTDSMWRFKKQSVYFYDYDEYVDYILSQMEVSEIERLKVNIYNRYHKQIKFNPFSEYDIKNWVFEGLKVSSPIIEIDNTEFAELLPNKSLIKKFFEWDPVREKYSLKSDYVNYVNMKWYLDSNL